MGVQSLLKVVARATWSLANEETERKVMYVAACCSCWCLIAIALEGDASSQAPFPASNPNPKLGAGLPRRTAAPPHRRDSVCSAAALARVARAQSLAHDELHHKKSPSFTVLAALTQAIGSRWRTRAAYLLQNTPGGREHDRRWLCGLGFRDLEFNG